MKRIAIITNQYQASDYKKNFYRKRDIIFAIGPSARFYAEGQGWETFTLKSLIDSNEYQKEKEKSDRTIQDLIHNLNQYSLTRSKNYPIEIGSYFFNHILILVGMLHRNYFILKSVLEAIKPNECLLYPDKDKSLIRNFFPSSSSDIIYDILKNMNLDIKLKILHIKHEELKIKSNLNPKNLLKRIIPKVIMDQYLRIRILGLTSAPRNILGKKTLLLLGPPYDWKEIFADKKFKNIYNLKYVNGDDFQSIDYDSSDIRTILNTSLTFENKTIYDLKAQANSIKGTFVEFDKRYKSIKNKIKNIDGVITSVLPYPLQNYIAHICVKSNKPIILWQHGEHTETEESFLLSSELQYCTHYLTFGKNLKDKLQKYVISKEHNLTYVETVGSISKTINTTSEDYILYATGKWFFNKCHFHPKVDPDSRLYDAQKKIIEFLNTISHAHNVVLKMNNTPGFNEIPFKTSNINVTNQFSFTKWLQQSKIVILDVPGTTLIEALSTKLPIFALAGRIPWSDNTTKLLQKRAVVANSPEELIQYLNDYLVNRIYPASLTNNEFLISFGSKFSKDKTKRNIFYALDSIV